MIWRDIVINYKPNAEELVSVLAQIFHVEEDMVNITDAIENADFNSPVICVFVELQGYFSSILSFYLNFNIDNDILLTTQICEKLDCKALISNDDNVDPYSMVLVNQEGILGEVKIAPDKLDEYGVYEIIDYVEPS